MKIEINKKELQEAIQDYIFKTLGDTAYISGFQAVDDNRYVNIDSVEIYVKKEGY